MDETIDDIIDYLYQMARTLDNVPSREQWEDEPADIARIYRDVAQRLEKANARK